MRIDAEWDAIGHKLAGTDPAFANVRVACIVAAMPLAGLPPPPPGPSPGPPRRRPAVSPSEACHLANRTVIHKCPNRARTRSLHSLPNQLNLGSSVHHITRLSS